MTKVWDGVDINVDNLRGYGYNETVTYDGENLPRFLQYIAAGINEAGAQVNAASQGFTSTSTTSNSIGTGTKTFTTQTGKGYIAGMFLLVWDATNTANFMAGEVVSYDGVTTGSLVLSVASGDTNGAGTFTNWKIALSGRRGVDGATWLTGSGVPNNANGEDGDLYLNIVNGEFYIKVAGTWGASVGTLRGPTGLTGATGPTGPAGSGSLWMGDATGTGNSIVLTPSTPLASYANGVSIRFRATATNTSAVVVNVSGLGNTAVVGPTGVALTAGAITSGQFYDLVHNGTHFRLLIDPAAIQTAVQDDTLFLHLLAH